jgi:hypothetical protein
VPQAHQIYNRASRIVDPDQFAGRGLDAGKTKFERLVIEPETFAGGNAICGGLLGLGTAIWTTAGISSVRSCTAAADTRQTMARGARCATARKSG